jgi:hypothetical protein
METAQETMKRAARLAELAYESLTMNESLPEILAEGDRMWDATYAQIILERGEELATAAAAGDAEAAVILANLRLLLRAWRDHSLAAQI